MSVNFFCFHTRTGWETSSDDAVCFRIRCGSLTSDSRYSHKPQQRVRVSSGTDGEFDILFETLDRMTRKWVELAKGTDRERKNICIRRSELGSEFEFMRAITPHVERTTPELWRAKMINELKSLARRSLDDATINRCEVFMKTLMLKKRGEHDQAFERLAAEMKRALPSGALSEPPTLSLLRTAAEEELDTDGCCPICTDGYGSSSEDVLIMPCSHKYHRNRITRWLLVNHVCPMCRFSLPHDVIYHDPELCSGLPFLSEGGLSIC